MPRSAILAALALLSCTEEQSGPIGETAEAAEGTAACRRAVFEDVPLTVCTADPRTDRITTALAPEDGAPYRGLAALAAARQDQSVQVRFAMNGGMFDDDGQPIGYYVENGERLQALNRAKGPGNFHMLPNGVFFGTGDKWEVRTSEDFYDNVEERPEFGTQSGPMLVIDGELHPKIDPDGTSLRIRNAVGIDPAGRALFVISDDPISFGKLARFYRDVLNVRNALFLDGTVSSLWSPATSRLDQGFAIGPLIVVEKRAKARVENDAR